jgi:hypothetical protein
MKPIFVAQEMRVYRWTGKQFEKGRAKWTSYSDMDHSQRQPHPDTIDDVLKEIRRELGDNSCTLQPDARTVTVYGGNEMANLDLHELAYDYDLGLPLRRLSELGG